MAHSSVTSLFLFEVVLPADDELRPRRQQGAAANLTSTSRWRCDHGRKGFRVRKPSLPSSVVCPPSLHRKLNTLYVKEDGE